MTNCYNLGTVVGQTAGGLAGIAERYIGVMRNCLSTYNITGNNYSGGITGSVGPGTYEGTNLLYIKSDRITKPSGNGTIPGATELEEINSNTIELLNNYIENDPDEINTIGCCLWVLESNGYPKLDFNTTWNGTEWESIEL